MLIEVASDATSILMTMTTTTVAMVMHTDSSFSFSKEHKAMSWLCNTSVTNQPQHSSFEENYTEQTMTISDVFIHNFLKMSSLNKYCTQQTMTISAGLLVQFSSSAIVLAFNDTLIFIQQL